MNFWPGILIGAIALTAFGLTKAKSFSNKLDLQISGRVHKVELTQITIAIDLLIKNPTNTALYIVNPFIKLIYQDKTIGSSNPTNRVYKIEAFQANQINSILFPLKYVNLGSLASTLAQKLQDKTKTATITVDTTTYIVVSTGKIEPPVTLKELDDRKINYQLIAFPYKQDISI